MFSFDFGPSFTYYPQPVSTMIFNALPWTLGLLLTTTVIAWLLGNMVGLVAGYFHKHKAASILEFVGILLYPIPYYILAVTHAAAAGLYLPDLPAVGDLPGRSDDAGKVRHDHLQLAPARRSRWCWPALAGTSCP